MKEDIKFENFLNEWLAVIDPILAKKGEPLQMRPLSAAVYFIENAIVAVKKGEDKFIPGKFVDYQNSTWFKRIYEATERWYYDHFGEAFIYAKKIKNLEAVTLIGDTPYLFKVPIITHKVEKTGEIWICFHDSVQADEDVLHWVHRGPNFDRLSSKTITNARILTEEIATRLRATQIALAGLGKSNIEMFEMSQNILPNLEEAANALVKADTLSIKRAYWPMQMACELVLKCLAQQRANEFKETHDLFYLYDNMPETPPPFTRGELSKLPNWRNMTELRYGGGTPVTIRQAFRSYRVTVKIVSATAAVFKRNMYFDRGRILIQVPTFLKRD